jgi:hypothetical protein
MAYSLRPCNLLSVIILSQGQWSSRRVRVGVPWMKAGLPVHLPTAGSEIDLAQQLARIGLRPIIYASDEKSTSIIFGC